MVSNTRICYRSRMTGILPRGKLRAVAALVAAYAIALQAVFTTLAPMQVQADGTLAVYCFGSANATEPGTDDPVVPAPAPGKMQCILCGACVAGSAILPVPGGLAYQPAGQPVSLSQASFPDQRTATPVRDGPARAPPFSV